MLSTVVLSNENQTCRGWEAHTSTGGGGCHETSLMNVPPEVLRELEEMLDNRRKQLLRR